jgi:hypothetical protein
MNSQKRMELMIDWAPARPPGSAPCRGVGLPRDDPSIRGARQPREVQAGRTRHRLDGDAAAGVHGDLHADDRTLAYDPSRLSFDEVAEFAAGWSR